MGSKPILIKEDVYNLVKSRKNESESFSDVIERVFKKNKPSLLEVAGMGKNLPKAHWNELNRAIIESRKRSIERAKLVEDYWK